MEFTPKKISLDCKTSAQAKEKERKIVFLAGTYVTGIDPLIVLSERSLGTSISSVSAEPPKARRSISVII